MKNFSYVMDKEVWNVMRVSLLDYLKRNYKDIKVSVYKWNK